MGRTEFQSYSARCLVRRIEPKRFPFLRILISIAWMEIDPAISVIDRDLDAPLPIQQAGRTSTCLAAGSCWLRTSVGCELLVIASFWSPDRAPVVREQMHDHIGHCAFQYSSICHIANSLGSMPSNSRRELFPSWQRSKCMIALTRNKVEK